MKFKKTLAGLALALGVGMSASTASAITVNFTGGPNGTSLDFGDFTVTASALLSPAPIVTHNSNGLGVRANIFDSVGSLDSFEGFEALTFSFDTTVVVNSVSFNNLGGNDDYSVFVDGFPVALGINANPLVGPATLDSFTIGVGLRDGDRFRIASIDYDIAPIPLPAAGWMLLAGLGGLYAVKRRKS